jgi:hypothetical protein
MKKIFTATLLMPKAISASFKVYKTGTALWDFINDINELTIQYIRLLKVIGRAYYHISLAVQYKIIF